MDTNNVEKPNKSYFLWLAIIVLILICLFIFWKWGTKGTSGNKPIVVSCSDGKNLADEINKLGALSKGKTFKIKGNCTENKSVSLFQDNITIDGNKATITGNGKDNVFTITGKNITIKNFENITGGRNGVTVSPRASLRLIDVNISNNQGIGLLVGDQETAQKFLQNFGDTSIPVQSVMQPISYNDLSDDLDIEQKKSWLNLINPISKARAQDITQSFVPGTILCNVNLHDNQIGSLLTGVSYLSSGISGQRRCFVNIYDHTIGGLGAVDSSTFDVINTNLTLTRNGIFGAAALGGSSLLRKEKSTVTINEGHIHRLCNNSTAFGSGDTTQFEEVIGMNERDVLLCPF